MCVHVYINCNVSFTNLHVFGRFVIEDGLPRAELVKLTHSTAKQSYMRKGDTEGCEGIWRSKCTQIDVNRESSSAKRF